MMNRKVHLLERLEHGGRKKDQRSIGIQATIYAIHDKYYTACAALTIRPRDFLL